jgi:GT2 family glycosyltransferase
MSRISINFITWNGERFVDKCLKSVFEQTYKDYSIIVIDNGSADDTVEIIKERYPHLKVIEHKENFGFAKAHNQAMHWTKSDFVLCLNQDVILEPDYLERIVEFMDKNPLAGAASGKVLRLQEGEKTNYVDTAGLRLKKKYQVIDIGCGEMDEGQYDTLDKVFGVSGAVPVYRRKALDETAYKQEFFDETFFSYKEDIDLAHRFLTAGWQAWRVPTAVAFHERSVKSPVEQQSAARVAANWQKKSKFGKFYSYRNHLYFLKKNVIKLTPAILFYELIKFFFVMFTSTTGIRAWRDYFQNKRLMKKKQQLIKKNMKVGYEEVAKWFNK